ncbi:MAG: orotidine-5'-phosphate decarboxylase [Anaerolineae bacterium]|nr:orotidine-5'-phosphate decarboxylase [Anaerolineae bacterium]
MTTFIEKLKAAQRKNRSWLCVGLDPDPARIPDLPSLKGPAGLAVFCKAIVEATSDLVCAYKPNLGFFLAHGSKGIAVLEEILIAIPPEIPVILDAKVGDIGNSQRRYGEAAFGTFGVDAMTVSPYVGEDAVIPLLEAYPGCGLFVLARTSNPGAERFQNHPGQGTLLYEEIVRAVDGWSKMYSESTVGLVVGATYESELEELRKAAPTLPFLVPGIGAQGGSLESAVKYGSTVDGVGPVINVSRGVLYASGVSDYTDAARQAALQLRDTINRFTATTE